MCVCVCVCVSIRYKCALIYVCVFACIVDKLLEECITNSSFRLLSIVENNVKKPFF